MSGAVIWEGMWSCLKDCGGVGWSLCQMRTMHGFVGMVVFAVRLGAGILLPQHTVVRLLVVGNGGVWVDLLCVWLV